MQNIGCSAQIRHLSGPVWVSGQIAPEDVAVLAAAGFAHLVNHRPDGEEPGQPAGAALQRASEAAGMRMTLAPVSGLPGAEAVAATARVLAAADDAGKVLMFCRSGMRSTAAWAMAMRATGMDREAILATAAAAGYDLGRLPL